MMLTSLRSNPALIFLIVAVMISSAAVIVVRHQNRIAFYQLQLQEQERDALQAEWGRLMLERATWTVEHSVSEDAGEGLGMSEPLPGDIVTVKLGGDR